MPTCVRCGDAGREYYWPEPGEPREAMKRAWLTGLGYAPTERLCSRCMVELATR